MSSVRQLPDSLARPRPRPRRCAQALWLLGLVACGAPDPGEAPGKAPAAPAAPDRALPVAAPAGRAVVAEVNGAPVYEDCVAIQAAAHGIDRRAALDQCIDFELLAQEAARRGLAADPEVQWTRKAESVRRLIDDAFLARYPDPDSVDPSQLQPIYDQHRIRYQRPELRETVYARAPAAEAEHPAGSPGDVAARALMEEVHAALAGRRDVTAEDLEQAARAADPAATVEVARVRPFHRQGAIVKPFLDATFAIPEAGMVSPPVRTSWGWDVILLARIHPAVDMSIDEVKPELFEILRRRLYTQWVEGLVERADTRIHEDVLARMQAAEDRGRFAPGP